MKMEHEAQSKTNNNFLTASTSGATNIRQQYYKCSKSTIATDNPNSGSLINITWMDAHAHTHILTQMKCVNK